MNFIRRRRRGAEEVIIGGNAPRPVSKAVVLTAAEREHGDSSLLFSFFLFCCSVSQPAGTALHYCLLEAGATRERERALLLLLVKCIVGVVKVVAVRRLVQE